ncbi:asparagine synthase (glutamine-hydrolyzing) [candidate division WOR-3 bacterium]|nr:asparagine synthase (glutamine-hydrolyzing) [candidate division WOR-3 bacterium]
MCGIVGFNFEDVNLVKQMCKVITHRGPDDEGYYSDKNITLGHKRLSIIDLHTGKQPIYNEDKSIVIVYNGEIYNYRELQESLETKGHRFYTASDTEVIIHAYEEYGYDCVNLLNGMFAFAIYDSNKKELFLARDRTGIKPLHYTFLEDGTFLFASEIKSLLQYEKVKREVDLQSLHLFINLRYVPRERTMFKGIKRLLSAHIMIVNKEGVKIRRYWEPKIQYSNKPEEYYVKKLRKLLEGSVKRHMISDVPVGVSLSGGIDSSTIVALASQITREPLKTFCMGFGTENDEITDARLVADHFNTDHHEVIIERSLLKEYPKMIWYADEPKRNLYPYYVSELVGKHVKTVQGGLGGDELFGGYVFKYNFVHKIEEMRKRAFSETKMKISKIADELMSFQTRYGDMVDDEYLDYLEMIRVLNSNTDLYLVTQTLDKVFDSEYLERIYGEKLLKEELIPIREIYRSYFNNNLSFIDQVFLTDFGVKMVDDFLLVDDRMNMVHSVESRVPFLDGKLVDFAFTIPPHLKLKDPNGKYILKMAMKDLLPKEVLKKEKRGFASETYETYLRELREIAIQKLSESNLVKDGYFKQDYINKVLNEIPNPRLNMHYNVMWNLLTFEIWYGIFINGDVRNPELNINKMG